MKLRSFGVNQVLIYIACLFLVAREKKNHSVQFCFLARDLQAYVEKLIACVAITSSTWKARALEHRQWNTGWCDIVTYSTDRTNFSVLCDLSITFLFTLYKIVRVDHSWHMIGKFVATKWADKNSKSADSRIVVQYDNWQCIDRSKLIEFLTWSISFYCFSFQDFIKACRIWLHCIHSPYHVSHTFVRARALRWFVSIFMANH